MDKTMDINRMLTDFHTDPLNEEVHTYFEKENIWTILDIQHYEPSHSAFLAWFFSQEISQYSQIRYLLNLLVSKADPKILKDGWNLTFDMRFLRDSILTGCLDVTDVKVKPEANISKISDIRYPDRIDILLRCTITMVDNKGKEQDKILEIIIENKIDSNEGDKKYDNNLCKIDNLTEEESKYKGLTQSERYYYACSKEYGNRKEMDVDYQFFVFLTPDRKPSVSNNYVNITYQDLVDNVIEKILLNKDLSEHTSELIKAYLHNLGNPFNKKNKSIIAMNKEEQNLLVNFFNRNRALFEATIDAMVKQSTEDGDEDAAADYSAVAKSLKTAGQTQTYSVIIPGQPQTIVNGHTKLAYMIVCELAKTMDSSTLSAKLNALEFSGCIKEVVLSNPKMANTKKLFTGSAIRCTDGIEVYCSNQWIPEKTNKLIDAIKDTGIKVEVLK